MNSGKKGPYILILLLVILLIFILGVQYGKRVKVADTALAILLSITPSATPKPTMPVVTQYTSYTHKGCSVGFLYPSHLKLTKESSREASFDSTNKEEFIKILCPAIIQNRQESSNSAALTIDGVNAVSLDQNLKVNNKNVNVKVIRINRSTNPIEFIINKELEPLIRTSIEL